MTDLRKIGLSSQISQRGRGHVPHFTNSLPPGKCTSDKYFFASPPMNGPLPAELKFRENTVQLILNC